ncbi:MAG TPA: hypothetical protein VIE35_05615, partial [Dongiaceae bacterium]
MDWDTAYAARERGDLDRAILLYDKVIRAGGLSDWQAAVALTEVARPLFERAVSECPHSFIEYEMAPVELKRLLTKAALAQQPSAQ